MRPDATSQWQRSFLRRDGEAWLFAEAVLLMLAARVALGFWSFPRVADLFSRTSSIAAPDLVSRTQIRDRVRAAIFRAWKRFPRSNTCFHRALAAHWMLYRRGINTQLYYGAWRSPQRGLTGHVWLMDGDAGIVGMDAARGLTVLARFPRSE